MADEKKTTKPQPKRMTPKEIKDRVSALKGERKLWESQWQEIADYIIPRKNDIIRRSTPGEKKGTMLLDNTAMQANELLAGALHGMLTSPNQQFFELSTGNEELDNNDNVRKWLQSSALKMHNVLNNSNFQTEIHELYLDLCGFGTSWMDMEEDEKSVVRFLVRHISEVYVEENSQGIIDEGYLEFQWNAKKIISKYGMENVPEKIREAAQKNDQKKFTVIQAVYHKGLGQYSGVMKFPYISQHVLPEEDHELKVSGFRQFPAVVPRWTKSSGETYGRSPGMNALPEAKALNTMMETTIRAAQKVVDPPMMVPDDGFILPIITRPAGINYYRKGSTDRIEAFGNEGRVDFGIQLIQTKQAKVREAYYVDQLQLNTGPQMTATEVMQRTEERMRLLGPMLGRQNAELLRPLIDRLFEIMANRKMFDELPTELEEAGLDNLDVKYSSMVARAQKVTEAQNVLRTFQSLAPLQAVQPDIVDNFDGDYLTRYLSKTLGFPQKGMRDEKAREEIRSARAKAQQEAAQQAQDESNADQVSKVAPAVAQMRQAQG